MSKLYIKVREISGAGQRTRTEGPLVAPPLFIKPTQGDPVFYVYGAQRIGVQFLFEDQCYGFYAKQPKWWRPEARDALLHGRDFMWCVFILWNP